MQVENEDQVLITLCSLPKSNENFVDTILYYRKMITMNDVNDYLMSKELKIIVSVGEEVSSFG